MKPKCDICGTECEENRKRYDKRFGMPNQLITLCEMCYKAWAMGEDNYLYERIKEKLDGTKNI